MTTRRACLSMFAFSAFAGSDPARSVSLKRAPNGGLQPQIAVDGNGAIHMTYFSGDPKGGNIFYTRSANQGETFSRPLRVNSQDGSAIAVGTIRGAQISLGADGRVHVAWNGSGAALPRGPGNPEAAGQPSS